MIHLRRHLLFCTLSGLGPWTGVQAADPFDDDPFQSGVWPEMKREYLGHDARVVFDDRGAVLGPGSADDPANEPIGVRVQGLAGVEQIMVLVDRNPIRKVLDYFPLAALPRLAFRFKLEQTSIVRAAARTGDGVWHVGGIRVESSGGGCTVPGGTRRDGSWIDTLGQASARVFPSSPALGDAGARLRLRVMHPMDTGLVAGIPAFYVNRLSLRDADDHELARLATFEPVSENPVFSFDFAQAPRGPLRIVGFDNNGNRIDLQVP